MEEHGGPERVGRRGQSRMGIASFVLGVLATLLIVLGIVIVLAFTGDVVGTNPQNLTPEDLQRNLENSPGATAALGIAGFGFFLSPLLHLIGLALGIAGLIQRRRKKLFSWLGTALNGIALLLISGLLALGAALGPTV
jgi:formate hydrogenlyase subunit 3/multisubunit Na+/H+ antiporter MnhD subunit